MAYTVSFGTTQKKQNSTSTTYTEVVSTSCTLKDACDFYNPTFTLQGVLNPLCNYAFCTELSSYYWIESITFYGGQTTVVCKRDVLATWKSNIGSTVIYAARLQTALPSATVDPLVVTKGTTTKARAVLTMGLSLNGTYVVTVAGASGHSMFACTPAQYAALYTNLYGRTFFLENAKQWADLRTDEVLSDVEMTLRNEFVNARDYIVGVIWVPYNFGGGEEPIMAATVRIGSGTRISAGNLVYTARETFNIPPNPWAASVGAWLNGPLGRSICVTVPGVGDINVSTDNNPSTLTIDMAVDAFGTVTASIYTDGSAGNMYVRCGNVAVPVGISSGGTNLAGAVASTAAAIASFVTTDFGGAAKNVLATANNIMGRPDTISTGGSRSLAFTQPAIVVQYTFTDVQPIQPAVIGRIANYSVVVRDSPGFIQALNASIQGIMPYKEKLEIESYMNGGFFYE